MSAERVWEETTLGQLYESGRKKLEESGVPDAALDARLLLLEAFDLNFASFLTRRDLFLNRPLVEKRKFTG